MTEEIIYEGLDRTHKLDILSEVKLLKSILKKKGWWVNKYIVSPVKDGVMFKVEVEHFIRNVGNKVKYFKTYLSEEKAKEIEALYDAIPRKMFIDAGTGKERYRPEKIVREITDNILDISKFFSD